MAKEQERDYSHRSLLDKLGVKEESVVSVVGVTDENFLEQVRGRAHKVSTKKILDDSDLIFYEANSTRELKELKSLKRYIKQNGAIWVVSLKGKLATVKEMEVITAAKAAGLVDNKVVAFSDMHTSLRLVIPIARRK
ncbi:MAG: DUF3052 domain-containing protein [Ignavibacteriae bacterium]|nr:DUF3052 domain-containing protein [Ignavibacteriota bacterium]